MAYKNKVCITCGKEFTPTGGRQKRCPLCFAESRKRNRNKKQTPQMHKCIICGKEFIPLRKNQMICGEECSRDYDEYIINSTLDNPYETENMRKSKPTPEYIKEVKYLLFDFGINIEIPEFDSVGELNNWKSKLIKQFL